MRYLKNFKLFEENVYNTPDEIDGYKLGQKYYAKRNTPNQKIKIDDSKRAASDVLLYWEIQKVGNSYSISRSYDDKSDGYTTTVKYEEKTPKPSKPGHTKVLSASTLNKKHKTKGYRYKRDLPAKGSIGIKHKKDLKKKHRKSKR